jgi:glycosyltransferase involved in cell wall biosynthesis
LPLHELRTRRLARWAGAVSRIHGPSDYIIRRHVGLFRGAAAEVIRHARAQTLQRQLEPAAQRPRTLGFIGALDRTKGVDVLLEALPGLERLGCEVRIAGDGKLRRPVEEAAASYAALSYLGTLSGSGKDDFFEACDVGVVPSVWPEPAGPPFALLEWLAAGRPAIASRRGGLGESTGLPGVVPIEPTAEELVAAVERLIADDSVLRALTESRIAVDPGDRNRWLGDHERILHEALR